MYDPIVNQIMLRIDDLRARLARVERIEISEVRIYVGEPGGQSAITPAHAGDLYVEYDTGTGDAALYIWDGSDWEVAVGPHAYKHGANGTDPFISISPTEPATTFAGMLWLQNT